MGTLLIYWYRICRFTLLRQRPSSPAEVPVWALGIPFILWHTPWRPSGRTFERSYFGSYGKMTRRLLPLRSLYLLFLFFWPFVAAIWALKRGRGAWRYWQGAMAYPDLALLHAKATYTDQEWRFTRPDFAIGMFYGLRWAQDTPDYLRLEDKNIFLERARAAGLPVPPTLSVEEAEALGGPIFVKSSRGDLGFGIQVVDASELKEYEDAHEMILQAPLKNHPALLTAFPEDAPLSTLRVTTIKDPTTGGHRIARCALRMGMAGAPTDNTAQGGIWANIDPETGEIKEGVTKETFGLWDGAMPRRTGTHPDTGRTFAGMKVPYWEIGRKMALEAQKALAPEALSMGWDIALAESGPVFLEVNVWTVVYDYDPPDDAFTPAATQIVEGLKLRPYPGLS